MITKILRKLRHLARFLPAFLLWGSFPPVGESMDVFFALALLMWYARTHSPKKSFRFAFMNGFLFWIATLSWMPAIIKNGGPWPLVVLGLGALSAYCALFIGAFGFLSSLAWRQARGRGYGWRLLILVVVEPILWTGLELLRSRAFGGFSWNQVGVALANSGLCAPAAVGGVYLLGIVVVLVNGTIASIIERVYRPETLSVPKWVRPVETFIPFLVVFGIYSVSGNFAKEPPEEGRHLRFALVQRNFPCVFKENSENPIAAYDRLFETVSHTRPDVVVLSESALAEFGASVDSPASRRFAAHAMRKTGAKGVIAGGSRTEDGKTYNSAALYVDGAGGEAELAGVYDKVHLMPFGEYIPFDKTFKCLQSLAPVGSCHAGEPKLLDFGGTKIAVAICYEDTDSALVSRFAEMGADVLVFMTNDSWFSESNEALAHSWQATARAVETGLPVVRVGNSGVTASITPDGKVQTLSGKEGFPLVDAPGCFSVSVFAKRRSRTPYVRFGDVPLAVAFALALACVCLPLCRR